MVFFFTFKKKVRSYFLGHKEKRFMVVLVVTLGVHVLTLFFSAEHGSLQIAMFLKSFKDCIYRKKISFSQELQLEILNMQSPVFYLVCLY